MVFSCLFNPLVHALSIESLEDVKLYGSFEDETLWLNTNGRIQSSSAYDGEYIVSATTTRKYSQSFNVEKLTTYYVGFWYRNPTLDSTDKFSICTSGNKIIKSATLSATDDWQFAVFSFGSASYTTLCFGLIGKNLEIDCVEISETMMGNLVKNPSFESNLSDWSFDSSSFAVSDDANEGNKSLDISGGLHNKIYQAVNVLQDTKYKLTFYYKGIFDTKASVWSVSHTMADFSNESVIIKGELSNSESQWQKKDIVFNSGENNVIFIAFQSANGADYLIDSLNLDTTDEALTSFTAMDSGNLVGLVAKNPYNSYPYVSKSGTNLFNNSDFETLQGSNWNKSGFITDSCYVLEDETAYSGSKMLKFVANGEFRMSKLDFSVTPDSDYWLTLMVRSAYYNENNLCKGSYGIADTDTGNFLLTTEPQSDNGRLYTADTQLVPMAADNEWHIISMKFHTGSSSEISFVIKGTSAVMYFDNINLFKDGNGETFKSPLESVNNAVVTNKTPTLLGIKEGGKNLIENSDFSNGDEFWANDKCTLFGTKLNVGDSGSYLYGNSLIYSNTARYPNRIYYIKWIDVEPNTEYTFSAKCMIKTVGNGSIGIISGHKFDSQLASLRPIVPTTLSKFEFTEENFDSSYNWQNYGVSFKTNDRNRIGIFVFDDGGEAYFDDLKLFKTSDADYLSEKEAKIETTKPNWYIENGKLCGVQEGITVEELLLHMKNYKNIKVSKNGTYLEDLSVKVENGMLLELYGGPTKLASATVELMTTGESGLYEYDIDYANWQLAGMSPEANKYSFFPNGNQDAYAYCRKGEYIYENGILTLKDDSSITKRTGAVSFKIPKNLKGGKEYTLSFNIWTDKENIGLEGGSLYMFYTPDKYDYNRDLTVSPNSVDWNVDYPVLYQSGAWFALTNKSDGTVDMTFTPQTDLEAGGYLCLRFQTGYGAVDNYHISGAKLTTSTVTNLISYDFDNDADCEAISGNITTKYTASEGLASGETGLKKYYSSVIMGLPENKLQANTMYSIKLRGIITWGKANVKAYAFKSDDQFVSYSGALHIADLGELSEGYAYSPKEHTFSFSTSGKDIDYSVYDTLGIVLETKDGTEQTFTVYEISLSFLEKVSGEIPCVIPEIKLRTQNRVSLQKQSGMFYGISLDGVNYTWQESNEFLNLLGDTKYKFALKFGETDDSFESEAGPNAEVQTLITGDVNLDGKINLIDLVRIKRIATSAYEDCYSGDMNCDAKTDSNDIVILKQLLLLK